VPALEIVASVAQTLSPLLYAAFIVVIWFQLRAARESVREVRQSSSPGAARWSPSTTSSTTGPGP
jgi:hypothetical protein